MIIRQFSFILLGILLVSSVFAIQEIGAEINNNDDGWFVTIYSELPSALIAFIDSSNDVSEVISIGGLTNIFLNIDIEPEEIDSIKQQLYYISFRNILYKSMTNEIPGYRQPDLCVPIYNGNTYTGVKAGLYWDAVNVKFNQVVGDAKCP